MHPVGKIVDDHQPRAGASDFALPLRIEGVMIDNQPIGRGLSQKVPRLLCVVRPAALLATRHAVALPRRRPPHAADLPPAPAGNAPTAKPHWRIRSIRSPDRARQRKRDRTPRWRSAVASARQRMTCPVPISIDASTRNATFGMQASPIRVGCASCRRQSAECIGESSITPSALCSSASRPSFRRVDQPVVVTETAVLDRHSTDFHFRERGE